MPFTVIIEKVIGDIETIIARRMRLVQQFHSCFVGGTSTFASIAGNTGTDYIVPGVFSTSPPWNNVV